MIDRTAAWVAESAGGRLVAGEPGTPGPERATIDSRGAGRGELFVGLPGARADGGAFAAQALEAGAWGAIVTPAHADELASRDAPVIAAADPLVALQSLANAWRHDLGCRVIGVTGSTGKTSTKDILFGLLRQRVPTHANRENFNTEIGVPLTILEAPRQTEALVLEMAMRGRGQIAELVAIGEPDVGVIVNVGPVHLELLGTIEAVAETKAEMIRDLPLDATAVLPADEPLLDPYRREDIETITFGEGGDVALTGFADGAASYSVRGEEVRLEVPFAEPYHLVNAAAALAALSALGIEPPARVDVKFSSLRGEVVELEGGVTVVNDCYNANPMSMRAALEHLAATPAGRHLAVLGTMAELGPDGDRYHREVGALAGELGIDVLITVGEAALPIAAGFDGEKHAVGTPEEAGAMLEELARPGDRVLVKGSRSAGLERVLAG